MGELARRSATLSCFIASLWSLAAQRGATPTTDPAEGSCELRRDGVLRSSPYRSSREFATRKQHQVTAKMVHLGDTLDCAESYAARCMHTHRGRVFALCSTPPHSEEVGQDEDCRKY